MKELIFALSVIFFVASCGSDDGGNAPANESANPASQNNNSSTPQTCDDGSAPSEEICDGIDNDCDGEIDEGFDAPIPADNTQGLCADNIMICAGELGYVSQPPTYFPKAEQCDGQDNDCDGEIDEVAACWPLSIEEALGDMAWQSGLRYRGDLFGLPNDAWLYSHEKINDEGNFVYTWRFDEVGSADNAVVDEPFCTYVTTKAWENIDGFDPIQRQGFVETSVSDDCFGTNTGDETTFLVEKINDGFLKSGAEFALWSPEQALDEPVPAFVQDGGAAMHWMLCDEASYADGRVRCPFTLPEFAPPEQ